MKILIAGATGSIGLHVVNTTIEIGHQPVALVRNKRKVKLLPRGTDVFYGDVSMPETLTDLPKDIDAIIFTLGSDGQGRIGARAIDYGGVRNILRLFRDTPVRIGLMTTIGVTERLSTWNQRTEVHDWKRRAERLVRSSGHPYTIVRPGWFDYNNDDEHRIVMLQGDRRHAGTPEDGVISRKQIALTSRLLINIADQLTAWALLFYFAICEGQDFHPTIMSPLTTGLFPGLRLI